MCVLILVPILFLFLVGLGFVLLVKAGRRLVKGEQRIRGLLMGLVGLVLTVGLPYLGLCWGVSFRRAWQIGECQHILGRLATPAHEMYKQDNPGQIPPAKWLGEGPEPVCEAEHPSTPYIYLSAVVTDTPDSDRWIVYCPRPHRYSRWVLWDPLWGREDVRVVCFANGYVTTLSEDEFQKQLREQMEMILRAKATSQPASGKPFSATQRDREKESH